MTNISRLALLGSAGFLCTSIASAAWADTATPSVAAPAAAPADTDQAEPAPGDDIIVTARAGTGVRRKVEASYSISTINRERLDMTNPTSVTEALRLVPGFWVESSGGEASGNVRTRGIPTDGFSSVALQEDGITIQHDPSLGFLNGDQAYRTDQMIERIEVVRGGPSSIFASNAPGALINFITRKGGDKLNGQIRYETATYDSHRVDGYVGGPIGDWQVIAGGFYRIGDGVRNQGFTGNQGGQFRLGAYRKFDDGGELEATVKHLDDHVAFIANFPVSLDADGDVVSVPGFDAHTGVAVGPETKTVTLTRNGKPFVIDNGIGTHTRLTQYTLRYERDVADGFHVRNIARYHGSFTQRNALVPYAIYTPTQALALAGGASNLSLRYSTDGTAFTSTTNGNGLTMLNLARDYTITENEFVDDLRVTKQVNLFGEHALSLGGYYAHVQEDFDAFSGLVLTDLQSNARLLDIVRTNADGSLTKLVTNGVVQSGTENQTGRGSSDSFVVYGADEWKISDKLRIDGGVRWEKVNTMGLAALQTTTPIAFNRSFSGLAYTIGANYQFVRNLGLFLRYTDTFRLPGVGDFITNAANQPVVQKLRMYEAGLKAESKFVSAYATLFRTDYDSYGISDAFLNGSTNLIDTRTIYGDTRTTGVEFETVIRPAPWVDLNLNATYQDAKFRNFKYSEKVSGVLVARDYSGNQLLRVPKFAVRATPGLNLLSGRLRVEGDVSYYTKRFADVANQITLPAYTQINANARFDVTKRITINIYGDNLTNSLGLTQGNPRQGQVASGETGNSTFIARPILGRSARFAIGYKF